MTMPISPSTNSTVPVGDTAPTSSSTSGMASLLQPETFLNLLVDELKYQDPLNPTSSSDFMNQISQLSQVEQLQTVSQSSQISEAANLVGKSVTGVDASGTSITGTVTGVTNGSNGPVLDVGGNTIPVASVVQIGTTGATTSTTTG
jgi:flagellar basal-body rod modification protein FlgD